MTPLDSPLRNTLERTIIAARRAATAGATEALDRLAVMQEKPYDSMSDEQRGLRNRLRAKGRQLGDYAKLIPECAYEHWHRMLFARFLAENDLLMHPEGVAVTLEECEELAAATDAYDGWELAARYASTMLPQIFRTDDPVLEVRLAPEHRQKLERLIDDLPRSVFTADDSLGWVYQYWQSEEKDRVNASEDKISGENIGPVTQLFTEPYMVQFLLHNTLGAWWMSRHPGEALPVEMPYLRTIEDEDGNTVPAAGSFDGWPDTAADITIMDPCCGSGHFLVTAFDIMQRFRMAEEGLSEAEAGDAVLEDNIFGLEIDQRCTQIAAFALAFAAWRRGGYRDLPQLNVACSGQALRGTREDWLALADGDERLRGGMGQLYTLFEQAPDLGSLIDPAREIGHGNIFSVGFGELKIPLQHALGREAAQTNDDLHFAGVTALGILRAAELLAQNYQLVITNPPYLKRGRQESALRSFCKKRFSDAFMDLATVFVNRCIGLCSTQGSCALVTPQNWLFLTSYSDFRERLLRDHRLHAVVQLGENAFASGQAAGAFAALVAIGNPCPYEGQQIYTIDASTPSDPMHKAEFLRCGQPLLLPQSSQLVNPDARIILDKPLDPDVKLLEEYATARVGIQTADYAMFGRVLWELPEVDDDWEFQQSTVRETKPYGGREKIIWWQHGEGVLAHRHANGLAYVRGGAAWGKKGVVISQMRELPVTLYTGELFDNNAATIIPNDPKHLSAIWAFCSSPEYHEAVRRIDQKVNVTNATLCKVPFDLEHWQKVAEEQGPLPEPYSEDPTQWLFDGNPARTTDPLQVAVARLLGYRWPEQEDDGLDRFADDDGIVCLPSISGERSAADRLRALLEAAFGEEWSGAKMTQLLASVGYEGRTLEEWLRNGFFEQHCALFHHRPFIWHIWDGHRDGFSALVNYHKLDRALLERLIYTYLGDWITRQKHADTQGVAGANARLVAAEELQKKLKLIVEGEEPFDIFVRWKPLEEQPIGWEPDLNDGVRLNIRPFMQAAVLRSRPNIKWGKDRGKNPPGSPWGEERINDTHLKLEEKRKAREQSGEGT